MGPGGDGGGSFGTDFSGKGYGGGGIRMMNFGTDWQQGLIGRGFSPGNFGLPGTASDYNAPGGKYNFSNTNTSIPGGYGLTKGGSAGESADHKGVEEVVGIADRLDPMETFGKYAEMGMDPSFLDPGGISSLSPTAPTPFQPETGIFGGTLGPKLKNAFPPKLRKFLGNIAKMHPATANAVFMGKLVKGYQRAEDKGAFLKKVGKSALIHKAIGNKGLGLSRTQQKGVGSLMNVLQGKQNMAQGLASFGTSAVFQKMGMPLMKKAFQSGGMPAVYGVMSALNMAQKGAQRGLSKKLAGPPGGG